VPRGYSTSASSSRISGTHHVAPVPGCSRCAIAARSVASARSRPTKYPGPRACSCCMGAAGRSTTRTVAGRFGHGSDGATVYAGWVKEADRRAADTMATIVPKPVATPVGPRGPVRESTPEDHQRDDLSGFRTKEISKASVLTLLRRLCVVSNASIGSLVGHRSMGC
jgi:hypothetical protein